MQIRQLSLFLENRPGQLRIPAKVLGREAGGRETEQQQDCGNDGEVQAHADSVRRVWGDDEALYQS